MKHSDDAISRRGIDDRDALVRQAARTPGIISFAGGLPDPALFPKRQLSDAFVSALTTQAESALQYGWPEGSPDLRRKIAELLARRGAELDPERVIITSGAQQAIQIVASLLRGDARIGVEPESYPGALDIFRNLQKRLVGVTEPAQLYYVMPSVSNPRGQTMADGARQELLARARRHHAYVLEDDAYDGTHFSGVPQPPLFVEAPERVFHVGTFSKTLCPGLRIGWLVAPAKLERRALRLKQAQDLQANGLTQALLLEYLRTDHFSGLQRRARARYRSKLKLLQAAVRRSLPQFRFEPPIGGFSLWLESDLELDEQKLLETAIDLGASFDLGQPFRSTPAPGLAIRLGYAAVPEQDIEPGVSRIAEALRRLGARVCP